MRNGEMTKLSLMIKRVSFALLLLSGLVGCGLNISDSELLGACNGTNNSIAIAGVGPIRPAATADEELQMFSDELHPTIMERCSSCHATQNPSFTKESVTASWEKVEPLIDRLIAKEKDGHCGSNCSAAGPVTAAAKNLQVLIQGQCRTAAGGTDDGGNTPDPADESRYGTVTDDFSSATETYADVEFAMGSAAPSQYADIRFLAEVRLAPASDSQPPAVFIRNIRVIAPNDVRIYGLQFAKNGARITNESLSLLDKNYDGAATAQAFSSSTTIISMTPGTDTVGISAQFGPKNGDGSGNGGDNGAAAALFTQNVAPIIQNRCNSCHAGGNGNATAAYNTNVDAATLMINTRNKVTAGNPNGSLFYTKGTGNAHGGGNALNVQAERNSVIAWINAL